MTTLRINITREVLEKTMFCIQRQSINCAISYAIRDIWPDGAVGSNNIFPYHEEKSERNRIHFKHCQERFISAFDSATPAERTAMTPFSFDIEVPDEVINEINIDEVRRICEGSRTLELVK